MRRPLAMVSHQGGDRAAPSVCTGPERVAAAANVACPKEQLQISAWYEKEKRESAAMPGCASARKAQQVLVRMDQPLEGVRGALRPAHSCTRRHVTHWCFRMSTQAL